MAFFEKRAIAGVESVTDGTYRRTVHLMVKGKAVHGWLKATPVEEKALLAVSVSPSLLPYRDTIAARIRRQFDLDCPVDTVRKTLGELGRSAPGVRLPGAFDGFETVVRGILGQQITVSAASTLAGRIASTLGAPVETPVAQLTHTFPTARTLAATEAGSLGQLGIMSTRISAIRGLAEAEAAGRIKLEPGSDPIATMKTLKAIRGIGEWTAQYAAMRALKWPDAFPAADYGVLKALGVKKEKEARAIAERWRPWRAYAAMCLWNSLAEKSQ